MLWHAIDRANDQTMRYVARELGWARKGDGGKDGADPGEVGWGQLPPPHGPTDPAGS